MKPQDENRKLREYIRQSKQRRRWHRLTAVLATAAAVLTLCVMVLPAVTLENTPQALACQLDLHTHTDSCYNEEGELVCGYADFVAHTHDSSCYGEDGTLICPLEERKPHTHMESCYQETEVLVCGQEETQGHTHSETCYETQLMCGLEESQGHTHTGHIHTEECYTVGETLVCTNTEPDHVHTEECYDTQRELTCTQDTGCYDEQGNLICGLSEGEGHTHAQDCYPDVLLCGKEEVPAHSHSDACYQVVPELVCGKEEIILHTHTPACYDREGNLICGQIEVREHVHDETCLPAKPETIATPAPSEDGEEEKPSPSPSVEPEGDRSTPAPAIDYEDPEAPQSPAPGQEGEVEASPTPEPEWKPSPAPEPEEEEKSQASPSPAPEEGGDESAFPVMSGSSWAIVKKEESQVKENAVMLFSRLFSFAAPRADGSYDFSEDITSVTVERQEGNQWTQPDQFTDGDTIRVTLHFTIPAGTITAVQSTMHYQLPAGIALDEIEQGTVSQGDSEVGTFEIGTNGMITITFYDDFAKGGEAFSGSLQFQGSIALADVGENQEINFGVDGGIITVVPEEKHYSLNIGKVGVYVRDKEDAGQYTDLNAAGLKTPEKHLIYNISVYTDKGSDGSNGFITVEDHFTHNPADGTVTYDENNIVIYKRSFDVEGDRVSIPMAGYQITYEVQNGGNTAGFKITGLPALGENEAYDIYYTAQVTKVVNSPTGYIEVPNMAAAQDASRTVSANARVVVSQRMVYKEGKLNTGTGNVQWTVNINEDGRDISGMTFMDTMTYTVNNQTLTYDPNEIVNLQVTAYSGGTRQGDVTELFTENNLLSYDNGVLSVTFPTGNWPEGLNSTWTYYITYETPYPDGVEIGKGIYFHNAAQLGEYTATAEWNGNVPEQGYGLVKRSTGDNLNTGTDVGKVNWQSTLSYPSGITETDLGQIEYRDWIADVYYEDGGQFIDGSHYTTLTTLNDSLWITNAQGTRLLWGNDFTVNVVYADAVTSGTTFNKGDASTLLGDVFEKNKKEIQDPEGGNEPIALFSIEFTSLDKLTGGRQLYITYQTLVDRKGVTDGRTVSIDNVGAILGHTVQTGLETAFHPRLQKQVKTDGMAPSGDDFQLNSDIWSDEADLDLGDTGGRLYYRILFYNYGDTIEFHDDMLQEFYQLAHGTSYIAFDSQLRIYNAATGKLEQTVKIWGAHMDNDGQYYGNYRLYDLSRYKDCIIGLYYSIDVSQDPAWEEGKPLTYTNTVTWDDDKTDSTTANVTNSQPTLKKTGGKSEVDGDPWVTYYVVINPEGRDLHPQSPTLELRDTLSLPDRVTANLRPETLGLYHYNAANKEGHYLGDEITNFDFKAVPEEDAANTYTFTVPDEMACVVVYAYQINPGTYAGNIEVSNTASLLGRAVIGAGDRVVIEAQDSSALVNKATLTIYKIGGNDVSNLLQGVQFDLHRYELQDNGEYTWVRTSLTAQGEEAEGGGKHYITGGDGVPGAIILNFLEEQDGDGSHYNTLYRLTEYKTLDGYERDPTPRYYVWGEYGKSADQTAAVMADALKKAQVTWDQVAFIPFGESKTEYIKNEPTTTEITVKKQWQGAEGTSLTEGLPDSVEVTLYQQTAESEPVKYTADGVTNPVTLNAGNDWTHTWKQLPKEVDGQAVTYIVKEGSPPEGWDVSYTYPEGANENTGVAEGEIIVINRERSTFTLPETGGFGPLQFAIAGLPLVGASGVVFLKQRRKRRRGGKTP